jgi:hypothetical protein
MINSHKKEKNKKEIYTVDMDKICYNCIYLCHTGECLCVNNLVKNRLRSIYSEKCKYKMELKEVETYE